MKWCFTLLLLAACAPAEEAQRRRDALLVPTVHGTPGGRLGDTLAACPAGGFIAADPVHGRVWMSPTMWFVVPSTGSLRLPVACKTEQMTPAIGFVSTAETTLALGPGGVLHLVRDAGVDAFAVPPPGRFFAAVSASDGLAWTWAASTTAPLPAPHSILNVDQGARAVAWNHFGGLFVGNPATGRVRPFFTPVDGGTLSWFGADVLDPGAGVGDFGAVVAAGNLTRQFNDELLVSAPNRGAVYLFSGGQLFETFRGGTTFGAAVVIDPRPLPGPPSDGGDVHPWYVSEPARDRVWRFVGTTGVAWPTPPEVIGTRFGQSLAMDGLGHLAVGAPDFGDGGAIFVDVFDTALPVGETMDCVAGQRCSLQGCMEGRCLGGVFCQAEGTSSCGAEQSCVMNACVDAPDAGEPDAGEPDAGEPDAGEPDAGEPDAGEPDAGEPDAGEPDAGAPDAGSPVLAHFSTEGCNAAPEMMLGLAGVLLLRRRPRGRGTKN